MIKHFKAISRIWQVVFLIFLKIILIFLLSLKKYRFQGKKGAVKKQSRKKEVICDEQVTSFCVRISLQ